MKSEKFKPNKTYHIVKEPESVTETALGGHSDKNGRSEATDNSKAWSADEYSVNMDNRGAHVWVNHISNQMISRITELATIMTGISSTDNEHAIVFKIRWLPQSSSEIQSRVKQNHDKAPDAGEASQGSTLNQLK
ncbi:hypothetical protein BLNAU_12773 [Blattamonas nauphoetae]|uniref:Uncharacterized protein n=1 Tax=Blattamonas nauphoetae TaxID=2049346 RepID=A0ABQ9XL77_9EUKA|nr:hypothetical protein BLNAU_12773 [Blattamonas nauphoetae]